MMNVKTKRNVICNVIGTLFILTVMIFLLQTGRMKALATESGSTYTLTYDYSDGRAVKTQSGLTKIPDNLETPTKEGFTFVTWSDNKDSSYNSLRAGATLERDTTIYAIWMKKSSDGNEYYLQYGGAGLKLYSVLYQNAVSNFVIPDEVDGLPVTELGINSFDSVSNKIETLKIGKYVNEISQIFGWRGSPTLKSVSIPDSVTYISGGTFSKCTALTEVTIPAGVRRINHSLFVDCSSLKTVRIKGVITLLGETSFDCENLETIYYGGTKKQWNNELSRQYDYTDSYHSLHKNIGWDAGSGNYKVVFENNYFVVDFDKNLDINNVQNMPKYIVAAKNTQIAEPEPPTLATSYGYTFIGWYKDKDCTKKWDFQKDTVTTDTTLYAKWDDGRKQITFDYNGKGDNSTIYERIGNTITKPTDPTAEGFNFEGWFKNPECTEAWNFQTDIVNDNITLYAKWTEISDPENPTPGKPGTENPAPENPTPGKPGTENPDPENPTPGKPGTENPDPENPTPGKPGTENPTPGNPTPGKPGTENPDPENPTPGKPGTENPTPGNPTPSYPEQNVTTPDDSKKEENKPENKPITETSTDKDGNVITTTKSEDPATGDISTKIVYTEAASDEEYVVNYTENKNGEIIKSHVTHYTERATITKEKAEKAEKLAKKTGIPLIIQVRNKNGKLLYKVRINTKNVKKNILLYVYKYDSKTKTYQKVKKNIQIIKSDAKANIKCKFKKISASQRYEIVTKSQAKKIDKKIAEAKKLKK